MQRANWLCFVTKGAVQYKGQLLFAAEGQGPKKAPVLAVMNPVEPYNTTGKTPAEHNCT